MRLYADHSQSAVQQNALRNLLKNASIRPSSQRKTANAPAPAAASLAPRRIFVSNSKFNNMTEEEYTASLPLNKDMVTISTDDDFTKEDAYERLTRPRYKMADNVPLEDLVTYYDKSGLTFEEDFSANTIHSVEFDADALRQDLDNIASRHAVMQERINAEFTGEEKEQNLKRLDGMIQAATEKMARDFSDELAGSFAEYGVSADKENIYNSVLAAVEQKSAQYTDFIKSNQEYADISGPEEDWLRKDSAYMSSELRKAMAGAETPQTQASDSDVYTLDEMEKMYAFSKELKSYSVYDRYSPKDISTGSESEESLGIKLAEIVLKGKVFNEYGGVSDKIKDMVNKSIDNYVTTAIDAQQAHMDKWSALQIQAVRRSTEKGAYTQEQAEKEIAAIRQNLAAVDKDAVYAVINKVTSAYEKTGDANKALRDGAVFAKDTFEQKAKDKAYDGILRYDSGDRYWNNFFTNQDKFSEKYDPLGFKRPYDGYMQKESGLDSMVNSWNDFMGKVTSDDSAYLNKTLYAAYA